MQPNDIVQLGLDSINQLLENFLGISDDELGIRSSINTGTENEMSNDEHAGSIRESKVYFTRNTIKKNEKTKPS